jgi:myo-inositol catabolism protein IolC
MTQPIGIDALGYDERLYILAFDHRGSFEKMVGVGGTDTDADRRKVAGAKRLIWEGFQRAVEEGTAKESAGILVDAQYGADVAREAKSGGFKLAMPVEKSGQTEFDFEYGDRFGEKIEEFDPAFSKVLVRYNPEGDAGMNQRQLARLRQLSEWLHERRRKYLFELLVPAEPAQLEQVGGSDDRYDAELRPQLMMEAILQLQNGGVEPDVWKIEGIEDRDACDEIAHLVRRDGRERVSCVVLGRGASDELVDRWLRAAAGLEGYVGFAIGRSIFGESVKAYAADPEGFDRESAVDDIARKYRRFIEVYEGAPAPA